MAFSPLYTSEIEQAIRSDPLQREQNHFLGVFASDELPKILHSFPASLVVNTDPANKPGTHWIAYYFDPDRHLDYFDSEGLPPLPSSGRLARFADRNSSKISFCDRPIQGLKSAACGYYCIAFLTFRSRGHSLQDIVSLYWGGKPGMYDDEVCQEVNTLFNVGRWQQKGADWQTGSNRSNINRKEQCSCSVVEWCCRMTNERRQ
jgi:hypothetical protein